MKDQKRLIQAAYIALKAMQGACDEWAAEFTLKKRAMNWGVVNDAYLKCSAAIRSIDKRKAQGKL